MKKQPWLTMAASIALLCLLGCEPPKGDPAGNVVKAPPPPPPPADQPQQPSTNGAQQEGDIAQSGFGAKGHYESNDLISVTIGARFRAEERLVLAKITHGLQIYKATHGDYPDAHEAFWKEVIEKNAIRMPDLKPGEEYRYDPELARETNGEDSLRIVPSK